MSAGLLISAAAVTAVDALQKPLKTFGTGASAFSNAGPERQVFNHTLCASPEPTPFPPFVAA